MPPGNRLEALRGNRRGQHSARINDIVHGRSAITASISLRLAKYFGTTPELWMNLQSGYELRRARNTDWPKVEPRVRVLVVP